MHDRVETAHRRLRPDGAVAEPQEDVMRFVKNVLLRLFLEVGTRLPLDGDAHQSQVF